MHAAVLSERFVSVLILSATLSEFDLSFDPSHRGLRFVIIQKTQHHYDDVIIQKTKSLPEPDSQISEIITSIKLSCQAPLRFLLMLYA